MLVPRSAKRLRLGSSCGDEGVDNGEADSVEERGLVWRAPARQTGSDARFLEATPSPPTRPLVGTQALLARRRALLVVDVQNDFITGSLAVKDAASIVQPINALLRRGDELFGTIVFSRDSHPPGHISFASSHDGGKPFTQALVPRRRSSSSSSLSSSVASSGPASSAAAAAAAAVSSASAPAPAGDNPPSSSAHVKQDLWPEHCVVGSPGWEFHPDLDVDRAHAVIDKGHAADEDSYSAFYKEDEDDEHTVLGRALAQREVSAVYCVGLAFDYCVGSTAIDAARAGFSSFVVSSLSRGVMPETCEAMRQRLAEAGVVELPKFDV